MYFNCIMQNLGIDEPLNEAPLELAFNSYLVHHGKHLFPMATQPYFSLKTAMFIYADNLFQQNPLEAGIQLKERFCAYRNIVFYLYPGLKRREPHPLPACVYSYIQAQFPPTDNEEDFADWRFSNFIQL